MESKSPPRLTNDEYVSQTLPLSMYHTFIEGTVSLHWHEFYELNFFLAGEGRHIVNGVPHPLGRGSIFLLTPADFHELTAAPGSTLELFNIVFSERILNEEMYRFLFTRLQQYLTVCDGDDFFSLEADFRRLWEETQVVRLGRHMVIRGTLERILVDLARRCQVQQETEELLSGVQHEKIRASIIYLHHHFREDLTLADVARQVHLSPNYFSECFRRVYGSSFQQYLQDLRMRFAMSLLLASSLPVTDICYASGFNTLSHFERVFRQKWGQTPRDFVRQHGKERSEQSKKKIQ